MGVVAGGKISRELVDSQITLGRIWPMAVAAVRLQKGFEGLGSGNGGGAEGERQQHAQKSVSLVMAHGVSTSLAGISQMLPTDLPLSFMSPTTSQRPVAYFSGIKSEVVSCWTAESRKKWIVNCGRKGTEQLRRSIASPATGQQRAC